MTVELAVCPPENAPSIWRGVIFDLDGTLVDSPLDFDRIRADMQLPPGVGILEALAGYSPGPELTRLLAILHDHELRSAEQAALIEGVPQVLEWLDHHSIPTAVLTRNSRPCAELTLNRLGLRFSQVVTREDAPPKPDPAGLLQICACWNLTPRDVVFLGDYLFDLEAGRRAGMSTILFAPGDLPPFASLADAVIRAFADAIPLFAQKAQG